MKLTSLAILCMSMSIFFSNPVVADMVEEQSITSTEFDSRPDLSSLTPEEQKWFKTFQEGTFLIDGWKDITEDILSKTPVEQRESQRKHLNLLGIKIGIEWCKDNAVRRVDNNKLKEWGKILKKTAKRAPGQLPEIIASIDQEISNILN